MLILDINYELYKVFYYVATTLSFSEASKLLFISQSAVSQSIKVLEKKLGITLFIRSTKRVQLTPEGETLLRHVEPAINLIARGEAQIMEAGTLGGGQLRIGASDTICRYFLVPYLNRFHRSFPNVHIKVTNQLRNRITEIIQAKHKEEPSGNSGPVRENPAPEHHNLTNTPSYSQVAFSGLDDHRYQIDYFP